MIFDEVGRGTSPIDGLAISYATLEHLLAVNKSRSLFATHFHDLAEMLGSSAANAQTCAGDGDIVGKEGDSYSVSKEWMGVEFWCTDVDEDQVSSIIYPSLRHNSVESAIPRASSWYAHASCALILATGWIDFVLLSTTQRIHRRLAWSRSGERLRNASQSN